jgi:hypothetical protein
MDDNDGRGARKVVDTLGAYIPSPTTLSGFEGSNVVVESHDGTSVREDRDVDERHLNDISENIGCCLEALYGSISGRSACSLITPNRWARKGSSVLLVTIKSAMETILDNISLGSRSGANLNLTMPPNLRRLYIVV